MNWEYIAGLLDGEGYIGVDLLKRKVGLYAQPVISIEVSESKDVMDAIQAFVGYGHVSKLNHGKWFGFRFRLTSLNHVEQFLTDVLPHIRLSKTKKKADIVLKIIRLKGKRWSPQLISTNRNKVMTLVSEIRALSKYATKGTAESTPVETKPLLQPRMEGASRVEESGSPRP